MKMLITWRGVVRCFCYFEMEYVVRWFRFALNLLVLCVCVYVRVRCAFILESVGGWKECARERIYCKLDLISFIDVLWNYFPSDVVYRVHCALSISYDCLFANIAMRRLAYSHFQFRRQLPAQPTFFCLCCWRARRIEKHNQSMHPWEGEETIAMWCNISIVLSI